MLQFNWLLSGVIVVEFFFAYKGFGALLLEAALNKDIFLSRGVRDGGGVRGRGDESAIGDVGYIYLNPRIRFS